MRRYHRADYSGQTFGELMALERDSENSKKWICECSCGKVTSVFGGNLTTGRTKSCGHLLDTYRNSSPGYMGYKDISGRKWASIKAGADARGIDFMLDIEDAWDLFRDQDRKCALSGQPLKFDEKSYTRDGNASLDRIDSSMSYTLDNVQWVDKAINISKWAMSDAEFIDMCCLIADYQRSCHRLSTVV
jgi:hypothetical protein